MIINLRNVLYLIILYWKLVVPPAILCPLMAVIMLATTEPTYISVGKIWAKEKADESVLLRIQRKGVQENTYAEVQAQIIMSNRVFFEVVRELELYKPQKSQSFVGRIFKGAEEKESYGQQDYLDAIHMLHKKVSVDVVNPEILLLYAKMNTPQMAQNVLKSIIEIYKKVYLEILNKELDDYEHLLHERIDSLHKEIKRKSQELIAFEHSNPTLLTKKSLNPLLSDSSTSLFNQISARAATFSPILAKTIGDASPIPLIMNKIGELEMQQNQLESVAGSDNYQLKRVQEEIRKNKHLLERYNQDLSVQAQLTIQHDDLAWQLDESRKRYDYVVGEYDKILVTRGLKVKQTSSITLLDAPSFEYKPIAPKKKIILIAATFMGGIIASILFYLFVVGDQRIYFPEDLENLTKFPVIAVYADKR